MLDFNNIHNIDCLEGLRELPEESIDLIITSPPYNLGKYHHTRGKNTNTYFDNMPEEEYQSWQIEVLNECFRVLKPNGSIMYNHKNRIKDGLQISPYEWIYKTSFFIKQEIVWHNGSPNFDKIRFYPQTERIYWLSKSKTTGFKNLISHHDVFTRNEWKPVGTKDKFKRAFPEGLAKDLMVCFPEAEVILDPYSGSGTTCKVAKDLNKTFIGFEKNPEFYELSLNRLNET